EIEIGQDHDVILLGLMTQRGFTGQAFRFLIQLKTVISGLWTEDTSAATEQRVLDASLPGSTGTFLAVQLPGRPRNLIPLLGLGRSLTLIGQVLLHIQVNRVIVGIDAEYLIRQCNLVTRFLACYIEYLQFHVISQ